MRGFSTQEEKEVRNIFSRISNGSETEETRNTMRELARTIVKGWKNLFKLPEGEEIVFETDLQERPQKELFDQIPLVVVSDIIQHISIQCGIIDPELLGLKS